MTCLLKTQTIVEPKYHYFCLVISISFKSEILFWNKITMCIKCFAVIFVEFFSYPNVVFLDVEKQKQLGYKVHSMLKYKSYTRKNIGYLYAIQHGAKIIYETDDDNSPSNGKIEFDQRTGGGVPRLRRRQIHRRKPVRAFRSEVDLAARLPVG